MLDPALVLRAYREGIFPMALEDGEIGWFSPDPRGIIPLDTFHIPARLARVVRQARFEVTVDREFEGVMRACAERPDDGTWISADILETYVTLHRLGIAHSVEVRRDGRLVGGLYGVHLGGAFFGESMFHRELEVFCPKPSTATPASASASPRVRVRLSGVSRFEKKWPVRLAKTG